MAAAAGIASGASAAEPEKKAGATEALADYGVKVGRINQSVVHWCFKPMTIETLCQHAARLGCKSVELIDPKEWGTLKKYGLVCAITGSHGFEKGLNNPANHGECIDKLTRSIEATADAGFFSVITFSGFNPDKLSDEEGIKNTVAGVKKVIGLCEKRKVNLCIEPLNTRVDIEMKGHPGYQCDKVEWAVEVCKQVGSDRMKILFDIYHTQIMQGDVITRIRQYKDLIGHYHTAGNPGRNDLDDTQEINYPAIMREIIATGYKGYVGQEFIPKDKSPEGMVSALRQAVKLCDV
jgi:hydroxypyruvate isomerase